MSFQLDTPRLILVQTPRHVLQERLQQATFQADIDLRPAPNFLSTGANTPPANTPSRLRVHFPPEWPGDALEWFPYMLADYDRAAATPGATTESWGGTLIARAVENGGGAVAVGQMGFKGMPDATGTIEIGYGITPGYEGRGYATEMVEALTAWALTQPTVRRVTAECGVDNVGSIRVLEKSGFQRVGTRHDEEDGPLILWERTA